MNRVPIPSSQGFSVKSQWARSFSGAFAFYSVSGPGALVRLVQFGKTNREGVELDGSSPAGAFWFEESLLNCLRSEARSALIRQQRTSGRPFMADLQSLVSLYIRQCLRQDLAICKNWTEDFDAYVRLPLESGDRLVALIGPVARQPAYDSTHPLHASVVAAGIWLSGKALQYVVDFSHGPNVPFARRISKPSPL